MGAVRLEAEGFWHQEGRLLLPCCSSIWAPVVLTVSRAEGPGGGGGLKPCWCREGCEEEEEVSFWSSRAPMHAAWGVYTRSCRCVCRKNGKNRRGPVQAAGSSLVLTGAGPQNICSTGGHEQARRALDSISDSLLTRVRGVPVLCCISRSLAMRGLLDV